jgi:hypothetical protein
MASSPLGFRVRPRGLLGRIVVYPATKFHLLMTILHGQTLARSVVSAAPRMAP